VSFFPFVLIFGLYELAGLLGGEVEEGERLMIRLRFRSTE
jgi:hypothetical protein